MAYEKEKKTAVALEYTPGEQAPKVIASGRGYLADKIIDVAKEENVPIHKDEKLARSLSRIYSAGVVLNCGRGVSFCG